MRLAAKVIVLLFCAAALHADGPLFRSTNTYTQQEFENVYQDLRTVKKSLTTGYLPLTGGTVSGQTIFTNSANAWSVGIDNTNAAGNPGSIHFSQNGTQTALIGGYGMIAGTTSTDLGIFAETGKSIRFCPNGSATTALLIDTTPNFTFRGNIIFNSPSSQGIQGATDGSAAAAGNVGEVIESISGGASAVNAQYIDITSITLTAGDWLVSSVQCLIPGSGATVTDNEGGIGTATGNNAAGLATGDTNVQFTNATPAIFQCGAVPAKHFKISSSTNYFLKGYTTFTGGTASWRGRLTGTRIR